jgi:ABC-2 type transport system ATP-binding protein
MEILIEAKNLVKRFRQAKAVNEVSLEIRKGEVLSLIGSNGAGKSTIIAILLSILKPDEGTITYWRADYRQFVGVQLQSTPFFEGYTAEENLKIFSALYHVSPDKGQIDAVLDEFGLTEARKTPAIRMSLGQQKRLAIAVTSLHRPELIVLDEPTAGLDPRGRQEIRAMIRRLAEKGTTVLFCSHDLEEVSRLSNRVILIHKGEILAQGSPKELQEEFQEESLESLYLKLTELHDGWNR